MSVEPLVPLPLWLAFSGAGALLLCIYGWKRPAVITRRRWIAILFLMSAGVGLLLVILLNPMKSEPINPPMGKPVINLLVDATASMNTRDADDGRTRYDAAVERARLFVRELGNQFDARVKRFTDIPVAVELEEMQKLAADGEITDLAAAIVGNLQEELSQGQAIILLSDGIHNGEGGNTSVIEAARLAKSMMVPVYTSTLGGRTVVRDLAIELRKPQELAHVGQRVPIDITLRQRGLAGAKTWLTLTCEGEVITRQEVTLSQQPEDTVRFWVERDKPGLYRYAIHAEPIVGEASLANNRAILLLRVVAEPVRVLVLEGKPYWDSKFFMRMLGTDPSIELSSVVRMSNRRLLYRKIEHAEIKTPGLKPEARPAKSETASAKGLEKPHASGQENWRVLTDFAQFLSNEKGLRSHQVIVLGRDAEAFLTEPVVEQLRTWVSQDGGSLLCYRGQPQTEVGQRLRHLLPVRWTPTPEYRFRVRLTERGRDLRWLTSSSAAADADPLTGLPTLAAATRAGTPAPLATVLATASVGTEEEPAVTYQMYGSGRSVVIEGAGMWRWAFLSPELKQENEVYRTLWHSLLHWLISSSGLLPGQKLALRCDKVSFRANEPSTATLLIRDDTSSRDAPKAELTGSGIQGSRTLTAIPLGEEPGAYRIDFGKLPEGQYEAHVIVPNEAGPAGRTVFDVRSLSEEQLDLQARPQLMERIARESAGAVLAGSTDTELIRQFQQSFADYHAVLVQKRSAWDRLWVLLFVLGVWTLAWGLRRSSGLI